MLVCVGHGLNPNYWFSHAQAHILVQVGLKRENEYIPIFEYILSFKDSSSYLEIGKSMQKIKL